MLRLLPSFGVFCLIVAMASSADGTEAQQKKKKKGKGASVKGQVVNVQNDPRTITVKSKDKKKGPATEKVFTLTKDTKIEKLAAAKKGKGKGTPTKGVAAEFSDIKKGSKVVVHTRPGIADQAVRVEIVGAAKKKKVAE